MSYTSSVFKYIKVSIVTTSKQLQCCILNMLQAQCPYNEVRTKTKLICIVGSKRAIQKCAYYTATAGEIP